MDLTVNDAGTSEIRPSQACPVSVVPSWSSSDSSVQAEGPGSLNCRETVRDRVYARSRAVVAAPRLLLVAGSPAAGEPGLVFWKQLGGWHQTRRPQFRVGIGVSRICLEVA
jgi:hypothetical protein